MAILISLTAVSSDAGAEEVTGTVTPTESGASRTVDFSAPGDHAALTVPVIAGESVSMVSSEAGLSGTYRLDWLDPKGEYLHTWYPSGEADRFFEPIRFEEAGEATLLIDPEGTATGPITFTLYDASDQTSSISTSGGGETKTLTIGAPGERRLVHFEGVKGQRVSLVPSGADFEGEFHVNTPAGEWLEGSGGTLEGMHGPLSLPEAGTYTLVLTGDGAQTGSLSLGVDDLSPVIAYSFDEGEGEEAHDLSGLGHIGSIEDGTWTKPAKGKGWSVTLNGKEGCVSVQNSTSISLKQGFTVEGWIKPEEKSIEEANLPITLFEQPASKTTPAVELVIGKTNKRRLEAIVGEETIGSFAVAEDTSELAWGGWHYVAMTFNGSQLTLYAEGVEVAHTTVSHPVAASGPMTVGCSRTASNTFRGGMDEFRLYSRALSLSELTTDKAEPVQPVHLFVLGQIAEETEGGLVGVDQPLSVTAGSPGRIEALNLRVDGELIESVTRSEALAEGAEESCTEGVCSLTYEFTSAFGLSTESGPHTVAVTAIGDGGHESEFSKAVLVDADLPRLKLGGKLFGDHGEMSEEEESVTVGAEDGEGAYASGIKSVSIYVDGTYVAGAPECEGSCPTELTTSYAYSEVEWGSGPHEIEITALDNVGNEITEDLKVNPSIASVEPTCEAVTPSSSSEASESTSTAIAAIEEAVPAALAAPVPGGVEEGVESEPEEEESEEAGPSFVEGRSASEGTSAFMARDSVIGGRALPSGDGFTIGQGACLSPLQTTNSESAGTLLSGSGSVLFTGSAAGTDTLLRNNGVGTTLVESFRGEKAPASLSWRVTLEPGQELQELSNGSIAVVAPQGLDLPNGMLPEEGSELENPEELADTPAVQQAASYDLSRANNEVEGEVLAVVPKPLLIGEKPAEVTKAALSITGGGKNIQVSIPPTSSAMVMRTAANTSSEDICAEAFEASGAYTEGCGPEPEVAGERPYIDGMDWAPDGTFVFSAFWNTFEHYDLNPGESRIAPERSLYRASNDGKEVEEIHTPGFEVLGAPKVSPNGEDIAFNGCSLIEFHCGIVVTNAEGEAGVLVASLPGPRVDNLVGFTANGKRVIYIGRETSGEYKEEQLMSVNLSGGEPKRLTDVSQIVTVTSGGEVSKKRGIVTSSAAATDPATGEIAFENWQEIYAMPGTAEKLDLPEMTYLSDGSDPAYNPTGTEIAVSRDPESGEPGIYLENADGSDQALLAATPEKHEFRGIDPVFSPDGSEVAYIMDGMIYTVPVTGGKSDLRVDNDQGRSYSLLEATELADPEDVPSAELATSLFGTLPIMSQYAESHSARAEMLPGYGADSGVLGEYFHIFLEELTVEQALYCVINMHQCKVWNGDRLLALDARVVLFTDGHKQDRSTVGNAFQHAFWTALMVRDDLHEKRTEELDNPLVEGKSVVVGLWFVLEHEAYPYTWDSEQDIINDLVGWKWVRHNGAKYWTVGEEGELVPEILRNKLEVCQQLLVKGENAIWIKGRPDPFSWLAKNPSYQYERFVYRNKRSNYGTGPEVRRTSQSCGGAWKNLPH